ncbi:hypothetical protein [Zoogloea sp.]|uniref:hypothetical protein n=1 Tax=Zoogloea sp. TaxID=49181 RepID=UPI0026195B6E|nr:hypothetical protein [uncultured Zoogloea sp.]
MQPNPQLSLRPLPQPADAAPRAELLRAGHPTGCTVPGAVLEFAADIGGRHLLFLTDDVPCEEVLNIVLLDAGFQLLDSASIGRAYHSGLFAHPRLVEPARVEFEFMGNGTWAVDVLAAPRLRLPFMPDAAGVSRPFGLHRHFTVGFRPG